MVQARIVVLNETKVGEPGDWNLCLQWCRYEYGDGTESMGYRYIWRRPNGHLQGARGQARIPSLGTMMELMSVAIREGWGHHIASGDEHLEGE
mgnify:CR=1 FL=1|jgi:hypothetical protein